MSHPTTDAPSDIKEELEKMNVDEFASTKAPPTDAPTTDPPKDDTTDAPSTDAPSTDAPSTDAPSTDAPTTDPPDEEDPGETIDKLRKEIDELLSKKQQEEDTTTRAPTTDVPKETPKVEPKKIEVEEVDFVGDLDVEDILTDKGELNKILNEVRRSSMEIGARLGAEQALRSVPMIVRANVDHFTTMRQGVEKFYKNNPDLEEFKGAVGAVAEQLASENPDWGIDKLFDETEKAARKKLDLHRKVVRKDAGSGTKPRFEKVPKTRKAASKPKLEGMQAEIEAMNVTDD